MSIRTQEDIDSVDVSFGKLILLFVAMFRWFVSVFKRPALDVSTPAAVKIKETYAEKSKRAFLNTFEDGNETGWNSNVDDIINDATALSEMLKDTNNEIEKKWKRSVLIEYTPRGNVFMFYDIYKQAFSYYCDQAVMPYELLNAVAMKYVLTFHCRQFFVDSAILPKRCAEESESRPPLDQKQKNADSESHFAKFKSYNTSIKKVIVSKEDDKIINRFLHLGPVRNWSPVTKQVKFNPINGFKMEMVSNSSKLSYLEYKNMKQSVK
jgi:hypothetical protein